MGRPQQLSLNVGGATVDVGLLGSIKFAKGVNEVDQDFKKGDDVIIQLRCRVLGSKPMDHYDAHGNVSKTSKTFYFRADDVIELKTDTPEAYKATLESEDDAVAEKARLDAAAGGANNGSADVTQPEQPDAPGGAEEPADDRHLASV